MKKDQIYFLKDRGLVYICGPDAKVFLQNIVTNDINKVTDTSSCFASLLTPQGKYLFDFIIIKHKQGYFLDCEKSQIDQLVDRLNIYKLNSKIELFSLGNEFEVTVISKEKFLTLKNAKDVEGNTVKYNEDPVVLDPRSKSLGARLIGNLEKLTLSLKSLGLKSEDSKNYYELSYNLGIAQINTKNLQEKVFGLECNFEELNGIDFKKGCYVGQENTARMKLKNKVRKKLFAVKSKDKLKIGSDINFNNIKIGQILIDEPYPFGLIKIIDPDFTEYKDKDLLINDSKSKIIQ